MNAFRLSLVIVVSLFVAPVGAQLPDPPAASTMDEQLPAGAEVVEGEPLLRGPIHEAYAEPLMLADEEPFIAPKAPPENVEELPPDVKPEGDRVIWIPGYWSWDDERQEYIWVSGVWRNAPVGRSWVSGTWEPGTRGYRWIPGRWTQDGVVIADKLPAPPPSLEHGPTSESLGDDYFWVPGSWRYQANRYVWRPGFWSPCHDSWVWVPDYYVATPGGCVFVPGYWDYALEARGVLFAPYYFDPAVVVRRNVYFSPTVSIDVSSAFFHLWVRPNYGHYYFGDYYDAHYANFGIMPWYRYHTHYRRAYDPLFVHYHWRFGRDNVNLYSHLYHRHRDFQRHIDHRPAHRWDGDRVRGGNNRLSDHGDWRDHAYSLGHDIRYRGRRGGLDHLSTVERREHLRNEVLRTHRDQLRNGQVTQGDRRDAVTPRVIGNRPTRPLASDYRLGTGGRHDQRLGQGDVARSGNERRQDTTSDATRFNPRGVPNQGQLTNPRTNSPAARRVLEQHGIGPQRRGSDANRMAGGNASDRVLIDEWTNRGERPAAAYQPPGLQNRSDRSLRNSASSWGGRGEGRSATEATPPIVRGNDTAVSPPTKEQILSRRSRRDLAAQLQNGPSANGQGIRPLQRDRSANVGATPPAHLVPGNVQRQRPPASRVDSPRAVTPSVLARPQQSNVRGGPVPQMQRPERPRASQMANPAAVGRPQAAASPSRGAIANPTLSRRTMKVVPRDQRRGGE